MTELEDLRKEIANLESQRNICLAAFKDAQAELEESRLVIDNALEDWRRLREWIEARTDSPAGHRLVESVIAYAERAEKVADAAVAVEMAGDARIYVGTVDGEAVDLEAVTILYDAQLKAMCELNDLVREYRARAEGVE